MRKFRLLPVIAVSTALMMGITGCESTTQKPAKEETKKEENFKNFLFFIDKPF